MMDEGYILRQVAILDRSKFGSSMYIFAMLKMATLTDDQRAEFTRRIETTPEILECHTIFGENDIMLKVLAQSLPWYQNFIFNVILKLPGVQDIKSTVTLMEMKNITAIPVRGARAM
jgi:Lrp/AsnC family transcriptional regulator